MIQREVCHGDHTVIIYRINSIYQTLFMGCVGCKSWIKHRFDSQSSFSPTAYHLPLISHYEDWGVGWGWESHIYHCSWGHPKGGNWRKWSRRETEKWEVEGRKHIYFYSFYSFRTSNLLPRIQFHITVSLLNISVWMVQKALIAKGFSPYSSKLLPTNLPLLSIFSIIYPQTRGHSYLVFSFSFSPQT